MSVLLKQCTCPYNHYGDDDDDDDYGDGGEDDDYCGLVHIFKGYFVIWTVDICTWESFCWDF